MKCSNYQEFRAIYFAWVMKLLSYNTGEIGSLVYAEKLGDLVDDNPEEWQEKADNEMASGALNQSGLIGPKEARVGN